MLLKWLWISFLGALISLDNVAVGQFMISRPICCGPIIGWILGDIKTGLMIGTLLEILWITPIPVGACVLPDIETSCIVVTAMAVEIAKTGQIEKLPLMGLAICISLPVAQIGYHGGVIVRRINNRISDLAIRFSDKSDCLAHWLGLGIALFFLRHFLTCFISLIIALPGVKFLIPKLTPGMLKGFSLITIWCPIIGLATVVRKAGEKRKYCLLFLGFALAFILNGFFPRKGLVNLLLSMPIILGIYTYIYIFKTKQLKDV